MEAKKKARLEAAGFKVGTVSEFLGLTKEDEEYIEVKLALMRAVKKERAKRGWTQERLAKAMGSGQGRVAKLENGDPSCATDLFLNALFAMGATRRDVAKYIAA